MRWLIARRSLLASRSALSPARAMRRRSWPPRSPSLRPPRHRPPPPETPKPTPLVTVPADWKTYSDPGGLFSVRYPASWFAENGIVSNFQLGTVGPTFPPDGVKLDVGAVPFGQLTSCATPAPGAIATTVGGRQGWSVVQDDPSTFAGHSIQVFVDGDEYCYAVLALFASDVRQYAVFDQFLSGLEFHK